MTPRTDETKLAGAKARQKKQSANRTSKGRFRAGVSGNPAGRPRGSRNKTTVLIETLLEDEAEALTRALITKALSGSTHALELVFARLAPPRRDHHVALSLPSLGRAADIVDGQARVIAAMAAGELTPAEARDVAGLLDLQRKAIETAELAARLAAQIGRASGRERV